MLGYMLGPSSARTMSAVPPPRSVAPYIGSLLLSSLIDLLLRHRLFFDLSRAPALAGAAAGFDVAAIALSYRLALAVFWLFFFGKILPAVLRGMAPSRGALRIFGVLATIQFLVNLLAINVAIVVADVNSYELLSEAIALYFVIGLIFVYWYWFLDYPLRGKALLLADSGGKDQVKIPPGVLFPEESFEEFSFGTNRWTPGFVDYLFFAMVAGNTFGAPEGHAVLGSSLKVAHMVHSLCMTGIFIVIVARAINTIS